MPQNPLLPFFLGGKFFFVDTIQTKQKRVARPAGRRIWEATCHAFASKTERMIHILVSKDQNLQNQLVSNVPALDAKQKFQLSRVFCSISYGFLVF